MLHYVATEMANEFSQFRNEFGLTQRELARLLGVARNTVARWEVGLVKPPRVAKLALEGLRLQLRKRGKRRGRRAS